LKKHKTSLPAQAAYPPELASALANIYARLLKRRADRERANTAGQVAQNG
jgi:hypothetical protein